MQSITSDSITVVPFSVKAEKFLTSHSVNGTQQWYNSKLQLHRLDGPAIKFLNGAEFWYVDGKRRRLDGPAVIFGHNGKYKERWVNGVRYTEEEFDRLFGRYKDLEDKQVAANMEGMFN